MPTFKCDLVFAQKLAIDKTCVVSYGPNFYAIQNFTSKMHVGVGESRNKVYYLRTMHGGSVFATVKKVDRMGWYQQLGHLSHDSLALLSMLCDFKLNKYFSECCVVCHRAEQT